MPRDGRLPSVQAESWVQVSRKHEPQKDYGTEATSSLSVARIRTRNPEHLAGGFLYVNEETFESATLTTFDGNDYFAISIKTRCMEILVQDGDSTYP